MEAGQPLLALVDRVLSILSYLHYAKDIKNARSFSLTFRYAGLEHLTFKVSLTKHKPDLKLLQCMADHAVVARTITTLICDDRPHPDVLCWWWGRYSGMKKYMLRVILGQARPKLRQLVR